MMQNISNFFTLKHLKSVLNQSINDFSVVNPSDYDNKFLLIGPQRSGKTWVFEKSTSRSENSTDATHHKRIATDEFHNKIMPSMKLIENIMLIDIPSYNQNSIDQQLISTCLTKYAAKYLKTFKIIFIIDFKTLGTEAGFEFNSLITQELIRLLGEESFSVSIKSILFGINRVGLGDEESNKRLLEEKLISMTMFDLGFRGNEVLKQINKNKFIIDSNDKIFIYEKVRNLPSFLISELSDSSLNFINEEFILKFKTLSELILTDIFHKNKSNLEDMVNRTVFLIDSIKSSLSKSKMFKTKFEDLSNNEEEIKKAIEKQRFELRSINGELITSSLDLDKCDSDKKTIEGVARSFVENMINKEGLINIVVNSYSKKSKGFSNSFTNKIRCVVPYPFGKVDEKAFISFVRQDYSKSRDFQILLRDIRSFDEFEQNLDKLKCFEIRGQVTREGNSNKFLYTREHSDDGIVVVASCNVPFSVVSLFKARLTESSNNSILLSYFDKEVERVNLDQIKYNNTVKEIKIRQSNCERNLKQKEADLQNVSSKIHRNNNEWQILNESTDKIVSEESQSLKALISLLRLEFNGDKLRLVKEVNDILLSLDYNKGMENVQKEVEDQFLNIVKYENCLIKSLDDYVECFRVPVLSRNY